MLLTCYLKMLHRLQTNLATMFHSLQFINMSTAMSIKYVSFLLTPHPFHPSQTLALPRLRHDKFQYQ